MAQQVDKMAHIGAIAEEAIGIFVYEERFSGDCPACATEDPDDPGTARASKARPSLAYSLSKSAWALVPANAWDGKGIPVALDTALCCEATKLG